MIRIPKKALLTQEERNEQVNLNDFFQNAGRYSLRGSYTPKKGDIFLMTTGDYSHAGIVTVVAGGYMTIVHGNTRESEQYYHVAQEVLSVTDTSVTGFGSPNYCYYGHDWHSEWTYYRCTVCGQTATTIINSTLFEEE